MAIRHFGDTFNPDMNEQLTTNFKLSDFCPTETGFSNIPDQASYNNIKNILAPQVQKMYDSIGPFTIISGFRASAVQSAVQTQQSPTKSFHEVGCAIDFYPTTTDINTYFGYLLNDPYWTGTFYEMFLKPPQNSIHLSIDPSGRSDLVKIMTQDKSTYVAATNDQIAELIQDAATGSQTFDVASAESESGSSGDQGDSDVSDTSELDAPGINPILAGGAVLVLAVLMMMAGKRKKK